MRLASALAADEEQCVAVVGAGGKKTTLYLLGSLLDRAVVTATVRIPIFDDQVARVVVTDLGLSATTGPELSEQVIELFDMENAATMREFVDTTSQNVGLPLDADPFSGGASGAALNSDVFMYDLTGGGAQQGDRFCFEPNASAGQLGLVTALPADHANEIQSDSLTADVTFYTEQCRHNDGSGMN